MPENPYQSPQSPPAAAAPESALRTQARRWFRVSACVLFAAALCNYYALDSRSVARLPDDLAALFRALNLLGFVAVGALVWFLGLPLLEAIARLLRAGLASGCDPAAWDEVLYRSLSRVVYLAAAGAALWIVWVIGYYQLRIHFQLISWAVGVPAHVLGACWYVPLIVRWYRLSASSGTPAMPLA